MPSKSAKSRPHSPVAKPRVATGGASWFAFTCILLLFLAHSLAYNGLIDDAFISFRYARNFAEGQGLVFNLGERVEGYTNFLWVLILSGAIKLGLDPVIWSRVLGIASGAGTLLIVYRGALRLRPDKPSLALAAPLFLAANRTFCAWSTGGLETSLFSFLCVLGIFFAGGAGIAAPVLAGTAIGFATLTRPEGVLIFGALGLALAFEAVRGTAEAADTTEKPSALARAAYAAAPFVAIAGAHLAFRLSYYGRWLPNTYAVKVAGFYPASGLVHVALFARDNVLGPEIIPLLFALPGLASMERAASRRVRLACFTASMIYLAYVFAIGGDHFEYRFFHPVLVLLAMPLAVGVARISDLISSVDWGGLARMEWARQARRAAGALIILLGVKGLVVSLAGFQTVSRTIELGFQKGEVSITSVESEQRFVKPFIYLGQWLGRNADPKETIVLGAVGAAPYYSRLRAVDILGLTEPEGGSIPVTERGAVGHERRADWDYIQRRGVTYYIVNPKAQLPGPDPLRLVRVQLPEGGDYTFQSVAADAKIQPGKYTWE